jgi:hypothetical protein
MLKMVLKQKYLVKQLPHIFENMKSKFYLSPELQDLISMMLDLDPVKRISPDNVINHCFFKCSYNHNN